MGIEAPAHVQIDLMRDQIVLQTSCGMCVRIKMAFQKSSCSFVPCPPSNVLSEPNLIASADTDCRHCSPTLAQHMKGSRDSRQGWTLCNLQILQSSTYHVVLLESQLDASSTEKNYVYTFKNASESSHLAGPWSDPPNATCLFLPM